MNAVARAPREKAPRTCRVCGAPDHDRRTCPNDRPLVSEDVIESIAQLRQTRDALAVELAEYERVKVHVDDRVVEIRGRIHYTDREIGRLRGER